MMRPRIARLRYLLVGGSGAVVVALGACAPNPSTVTQSATPSSLTVNEFALPTPPECSAVSDVSEIVSAGTTAVTPDYSCGPAFLVTGPDHNLWITNSGGDTVYSAAYDSSTTTLTPTSHQVTAGRAPTRIADGPDGGVWFAETGPLQNVIYTLTGGAEGTAPPPPTGPPTVENVGELIPDLSNPSANPTLNELPLNPPIGGAYPFGIGLGPDGNIWFGQLGTVGFLFAPNPVESSAAGLRQNADPSGIVAGPDRTLWFAEAGLDKIAQYDPSDGTLNEFKATAGTGPVVPTDVTIGADGNLWYTESLAHKIGRMAIIGTESQPTGAIIGEYSTPTTPSNPATLALGPDCNIWFTEMATSLIGSVDQNGNVTEYAGLTSASQPLGIALGPDGNLWVAESADGQVAQIMPSGGWSNTKCSGITLPAIAKCQPNTAPILDTDPNKCVATITLADMDNGSSDPNNPSATPSETVVPPTAQGPLGTIIEPPITIASLRVSPAAASPNTSPAVLLPVSSCQRLFFVEDKQPPTINCPAATTVQCTSSSGATVAINPTVSDNCPGVGKAVCTPAGSSFGFGTTAISCSVKDASGNENTCSTSVTVTNPGPIISRVAASPSTIPASARLIPITVNVNVSAPCDPNPPVCKITSIGNDVGQITGPLKAQILAVDEFFGLLPRDVTLTVQCTDNNGVVTTGNATVVVAALVNL
jgi:virginiamycin B lyase